MQDPEKDYELCPLCGKPLTEDHDCTNPAWKELTPNTKTKKEKAPYRQGGARRAQR